MTALSETKRYQAYSEYKDSGVEWLEEVPSDWDVIKIKHLSPVKRGASPRPIDDPKYFDEEGEYAWVRIADVSASKTYLETTTQTMSELGSSLSVKLEPNQLFLSIAGTVGKPCINKIKACIHDGFVYFPDLKIPNKYLFYVFAGEQAYKGLGKMGTQLNLNTDTVGDIKVTLPREHGHIEKIVHFLDHETAKIDTLIEKQQQLIKLLKEKRQAVISHAVTKGISYEGQAQAPMKDSGVEWLGEVPEHWDVSQLKYDVNPQTSITYGIVQAGPHIEDGIPYIKTSDMSGDELPLDGYSKTSVRIDAAYKRSKVFEGDIVVAIRASVGKSLLVPKKLDGANLTQGTAKISCGLNMLPRFLLAYLNSVPVQGFFSSISKGATFKEITLDSLRRLPTLVPSLPEQEKLIQYIGNHNEIFMKLIKSAEIQVSLLRERRTALISAAVTGKIDVRNWGKPKETKEVN